MKFEKSADELQGLLAERQRNARLYTALTIFVVLMLLASVWILSSDFVPSSNALNPIYMAAICIGGIIIIPTVSAAIYFKAEVRRLRRQLNGYLRINDFRTMERTLYQ